MSTTAPPAASHVDQLWSACDLAASVRAHPPALSPIPAPPLPAAAEPPRSYLAASTRAPAPVTTLRATAAPAPPVPLVAELASVPHAAVHAARFRQPAERPFVQSVLLQSLQALAACEEAHTLPTRLDAASLQRAPAPEHGADGDTFTVTVRVAGAGPGGKGRGGKKRGGRVARRRREQLRKAGASAIVFEVRPFAGALRRHAPRLALPAAEPNAHKRDVRSAADLPSDLLTLPPECLFFGDQLPAGHCDAVPTYTARSALWSAAMLVLHAAQPGGVSPLLRAVRPVGCCTAAAAARDTPPSYTWRVPAPGAFVADVADALAHPASRLARVLVPAALRGAAWEARVRDLAHYAWGLVELLGLPDPARDLEPDARQAFAHSTLFALVRRHAAALRYARMRAPDVPSHQCCGWLMGLSRDGSALPGADALVLQANLRRQRPTLRAMLAWDQWRGRHRADHLLRKLLGALVDGPLVRHLRDVVTSSSSSATAAANTTPPVRHILKRPPHCATMIATR